MECESAGVPGPAGDRQVSPTGPGYITKGADSGLCKHTNDRSAPCEALSSDCRINK